jgi:hypothetical protein
MHLRRRPARGQARNRLYGFTIARNDMKLLFGDWRRYLLARHRQGPHLDRQFLVDLSAHWVRRVTLEGLDRLVEG